MYGIKNPNLIRIIFQQIYLTQVLPLWVRVHLGVMTMLILILLFPKQIILQITTILHQLFELISKKKNLVGKKLILF